MSELDLKSVKSLSELCRIGLTDAEAETLLTDLNTTLDSVKKLQELDTENVKPCFQVQDDLHNVQREDHVQDLYSREEFLANAPDHVGGMVRVPIVIQGQ